MATALLDDGYRVAGFDVDGTNLGTFEGTYPERARFHRCDLTADDDVERAVEAVLDEWGRIGVLVNNAAAFEFAPSRR